MALPLIKHKGSGSRERGESASSRALAIDEASFGSDHPDVAIDLNNLALLLLATNRLSEAEPMLRRAAEIFERSPGPDHPNTQIVQRNLATLLEKIARPEGA